MSKIKFWQMIGRGTRTCDDLKILSPSNAYFERRTNESSRQLYQSKQGFLIFDVCGAFSFFKMNPEGREDRSDQILSLNQKIFMEKVALFKAMQFRYAMLPQEDKDMYGALRDSLVAEVASLNRNYIGVQRSLQVIEKYSELAGWEHFTQGKFVEVKKQVAPQAPQAVLPAQSPFAAHQPVQAPTIPPMAPQMQATQAMLQSIYNLLQPLFAANMAQSVTQRVQ